MRFSVGAVSLVVQCISVEPMKGWSTKPETPSSLQFWQFPPRWYRWCLRTQRHPGPAASPPGSAWPGTGTGTGPAKPPEVTRGQCLQRENPIPAAPPAGTHNVAEDSRPCLVGQPGCLEDIHRALRLQLANQGRQSAEGSG